MKKISILKGIFSAVMYFLIAAIGALLVLMLFFGARLYSIQTGSMEPNYPVGTMIVVEPVEFDQLRKGDVITFVSGGMTVTHRLIDIDKDTRQLTTKGDNNNVADSSELSYDNVIGRVEFAIPYVGYLVLMLNTTFGKIMAGVVIAAIIGVLIIIKIYESGEDEEDDEMRTRKKAGMRRSMRTRASQKTNPMIRTRTRHRSSLRKRKNRKE